MIDAGAVTFSNTGTTASSGTGKPLGVREFREAHQKRYHLRKGTLKTHWSLKRLFAAFLGPAGRAGVIGTQIDNLTSDAAHKGLGTQKLAGLASEIAGALTSLDILAARSGIRCEFLWDYDHPFSDQQSFDHSEDIITDLGIWLGHLAFACRDAPADGAPMLLKSIKHCQKYLIILAHFHGIHVSTALRAKFNRVSEKYDFPVAL